MCTLVRAFIWVVAVSATTACSYHSHESAVTTYEKLSDLVFSRSVPTSAVTDAFIYKDFNYPFRNLQDINLYNRESAHAVDGTAQRIYLEDAPLESPYWWTVESSAAGAEALITEMMSVFADFPGPDQTPRHFSADWGSVLRKALAQRDLFQIYSLVDTARERAASARSKTDAVRVERLLAALFESTLLTEDEYFRLRKQLPTREPVGFASQPSTSLAVNYLPLPVVGQDPSWVEIPQGDVPFRHFTIYGGRSFIRVFVRAPNLDARQIGSLWSELFRTYGSTLHTKAVQQPVPRGMETLLVRTFGVFLRNGDYRDSTWPEEVIIRKFKYPTATLDMETSDFRGTLFYQYKMSRRRLLASPATLGLRRIRDDDPVFFGFLTDVPDRHKAISDTVTTMRSNCIGCHEELFYGLNTIFSFERDPGRDVKSSNVGAILKTTSNGSYRLQTSAAVQLQDWLRALE